MAGYSSKSLGDKLGIKPGSTVLVIGSPTEYAGFVPETSYTSDENTAAKFDIIHFFAKEKAELKRQFPRLKEKLSSSGSLWVSWPKKAAKIETDLNENIIMEIGLNGGLVDVKVIAVDEVWSGLKFVYRVKDR